jgi:alcohol dehydrogenase class IV
MNIFKKFIIRTYQFFLKIGTKFIRFRKPIILNDLKESINYLKDQKVLIIIPSNVSKNQVFEEFISDLKQAKINYQIAYCDIANPTIQLVDEYYSKYQPTLIMSIGGGSVIDLGKLLAVKMTNKKDLRKMRGILKVRRKPITQIAVPTTSGSGSEATVAAVVSCDITHEKYPINDPKIVPDYALLESRFTVTLPKHLTSTTGMDALTHAIECYLGKANTKDTLENSVTAIKLIFESLESAYLEPTNLMYRSNMQKAAYLAGCAFTKGYVGYVHAIAHQLGGLYHTPHGLANAVLLPYVLEEYGDSINKKVQTLGNTLGIVDFDLVCYVKKMNETLEIPKYIETLKEEDFDLIIKRAKLEAHPLYPVPKLFSDQNFLNILYKALKR